jgi:AcrR family transcriptional regulator
VRTPGSTADATRVRVEAAAVSAFARDGYAATGIRALAQEAGLTSAALYHYIGSKEDLLAAIMRSTIEPLISAAERTLERGPAPEEALATLVELQVWLHGARPRATLIADTEVRALGGRARGQIVALRDRYEATWRAVLADGRRAGRFDVADDRVAATALLGLCNQVSHWYSPHGRLALAAVCAMHADLALGLVRARRGTRPVRRAQLSLPEPRSLLELPRELLES